MPPDITPKKSGTIGGVKKEYAYAGGAIAAVLIVVVYMRTKSTAAATTAATTVTDPAGNVCAALSPTSGYCLGSPEDLSYNGMGANLVGQNSSSYVGGQVIGYDQYGNPIYSSSSSATGVPGEYTNNAQWTQAALASMQQADPNTDSGTITAALGVYINGDPATSDQQSLIQQAIALQGFPPIGGNGGYPPSIKNSSPSTATTTTPSSSTPKAPYVSVHTVTANSVTLAATGGFNSYKVAYSANYGNWNATYTTGNFTVGALRSKTAFTFTVTGVYKGVSSPPTTVNATTK
jgi:hypothetical protein